LSGGISVLSVEAVEDVDALEGAEVELDAFDGGEAGGAGGEDWEHPAKQIALTPASSHAKRITRNSLLKGRRLTA
jgi:hypothetical protein